MRSLSAVLLTALGVQAQWQNVQDWGANPSDIQQLRVYVPAQLEESPAIVLGLHPCGGTGQMYAAMTGAQALADALGFVALYPTTNKQSNCWDCHSVESNTHDGGGDSEGLVNMVQWALETYNGDPSRVFVMGGSSGAMMTNVLAATYPEVFAAGASYSGVPAGCWRDSPMSTPFSPDQSCPLGEKAGSFTGEQWGDLARQAYPGYEGPRPRMYLVHGTLDLAVVPAMLGAQLEQWSDVLGLGFTENRTNDPQDGWTKMVYGDGTRLVGVEVEGGGHIPQFQWRDTFEFFGLL